MSAGEWGFGGGRPLRVAVVGAGPAGVYAADVLTKTEAVRQGRLPVSIDLFDALPAPFGLIRYGVAPDHPRIKGIIQALHKIMDRGDLRFFGNVTFGSDIDVAFLRWHYDAIIFATGASRDADLPIPGVNLEGSFGAADFVSWYDGHPEGPRHWPLTAQQVAVIGNGNVALDVSRILAKPAVDLLSTEIPENVYRGLAESAATDIHIFGRRGPAQVKFTPLELRELAHCRDVDIILYPEDFVFDAASDELIRSNNQVRTMVATLTNWVAEQPEQSRAARRLHLHFYHRPVEVVGRSGAVAGVTFERTVGDGRGAVVGTGEMLHYPVQAVYRAVGYASSPVPGVPFDESRRVISQDQGRVLASDGSCLPGLYTAGWVKRGPVGLIGHTKSDAMETVAALMADVGSLPRAAEPEPAAAERALREGGVAYTTWSGWKALDAYERQLGAEFDSSPYGVQVARERVKVVPREVMVRVSRQGGGGSSALS